MKKILMIGAGFLQTYVIQKARTLGYYVCALDGSPTAPGLALADESAVINIVDQEACLAYARAHQVDGVLTAATDYGVLTASHIARQMGLPGTDYSAVMTIKNKYLTKKALMAAHADDTDQVCQVTSQADIPVIGAELRFPVMVKPCDGSGSRGASRVDRLEDFASACREAMACSLTGKAIVETFISGQEYGVESFVCQGKVTVLAVMKKWMTQAPCYAELGHGIPSGLPAETEQRIKTCAETAIRALKVDFGSVNMDLLLSADGSVHIVDIGARMGGNLIGSHIIPLGTGMDYTAAMIQAAAGDPVSLEPVQPPVPVVTRLLALTPGTVKALPDFAQIAQDCHVEIQHHLAVGDRIRPYRTNLDGCGYVVALGEDALSRAEEALKRIDKEIVR